ncbi:MAG: hypothetical protein Q9164_003101, partial [Protoblastenia rupestris]
MSEYDAKSHLIPPPLSLWKFTPDNTGSGAWTESIREGASAWTSLTRPKDTSVANDPQNAWVLGGVDEDINRLGSMVRFNMDTETFTNSSGTSFPSPGSRGAMHYVPVYGPSGIFIALGGIRFDNKPDPYADFGTLRVFDPASQKWHEQKTTGNKPAGRVDHCVAGAASSNQTYEIFVYSGFDGNLGTAAVPFDTINILTLPAFHWISVPYNPQNPRYGHTCHAVGGSQIVVVGGADANSKVTDGGFLGIAESIMESPDPLKQGLGIFDLSTLSWSDRYRSSPPPYTQSSPIQQYYLQAQ